MMIKRSPNLSAVRRKSYEAVLRFQIYKVKREHRGFSMCAGLGVPSRLVISRTRKLGDKSYIIRLF